VVVGNLVRDPNGLALSSRNTRLGEQGLVAALALHGALQALKDACLNGTSLEDALDAQRASLDGNPEVALEYLEVVNAITFEKATEVEDTPHYAIVAASVNGVRLIDNVALTT
jgi:pantoate--beta-alanine ligase